MFVADLSFRPKDLDYNSASDPMYMRPFLGVPDNDATGKQKIDSNGNPVWKEKGWWFHGDYKEPPAAGQFLEVPTGGTLRANIANHKNLTPYGWRRQQDLDHPFAAYCDDPNTCSSYYSRTGVAGMLHLPGGQNLATPLNQASTKGCGFAIAYKSDFNQLKPEDFTVISINGKCPFYKTADFQIPAGMKACPPEGCHCMWGWIHDTTGHMENYLTGFRCKVTGSVGTKTIGIPKVARNCNNGGCQSGPKQMHFWLQKERNNNNQPWENPPFYNSQYGFNEGAQNDIFQTVARRNHSRDFSEVDLEE